MSFDLKPIFRDEEKEIRVEAVLNPVDYDNLDERFSDDISVKGKISKRRGIVTFTADVIFTVEAPCDRCALPVRKSFKIHISEKIADRLENEADNDEYILIPDMKFDISETVITAVVLSLPGKFLCKEDCRGICPNCGKNLNDGGCDCTNEVKDSRWAALSQLLD